MKQKTLNLNGNIIYCYEDGSVEWLNTYYKRLHKTFGFKNSSRNGIKRNYLCVHIKGKIYQVHRLIAMAWHPNPNELQQVDHIDNNPANNRPENLRWADNSLNSRNRDYVRKANNRLGLSANHSKAEYQRARRRYLKEINDEY